MATDFSYFGEQTPPEGIALPGSRLPVGQIGMFLTDFEFMGVDTQEGEVLVCQIGLEVYETPGHDGQTSKERVFIGQTANVQLGIESDPFAENPETVKKNTKLLKAMGLAVGVDIETHSNWNQAMAEIVNRPFLGTVIAKARTDDPDQYNARLVDAKEWNPEKVRVDEDPTPRQGRGARKPDHAHAPTLGARAGASAAPPAAAPKRPPAQTQAPATAKDRPVAPPPAAAAGRPVTGRIPARR